MGKLGEHIAQRDVYHVQKTANESDQYSLRYTAGSDGTRQHITSHCAVLPCSARKQQQSVQTGRKRGPALTLFIIALAHEHRSGQRRWRCKLDTHSITTHQRTGSNSPPTPEIQVVKEKIPVGTGVPYHWVKCNRNPLRQSEQP